MFSGFYCILFVFFFSLGMVEKYFSKEGEDDPPRWAKIGAVFFWKQTPLFFPGLRGLDWRKGNCHARNTTSHSRRPRPNLERTRTVSDYNWIVLQTYTNQQHQVPRFGYASSLLVLTRFSHAHPPPDTPSRHPPSSCLGRGHPRPNPTSPSTPPRSLLPSFPLPDSLPLFS
ncbi:hypothetical protein T439DRAFT_106271 [Meredithblackwellia eburnea MCA 4105]